MLYSRIIDGAAVAESQKLHDRVPEKYRWHYWLWLTLGHPVNGTFEANAEKIHRDLYAYQFSSTKIKDVTRLLSLYKDAGLLVTWRCEGKTWGFLLGNDKKGRVVGERHRNRYVNVPPSFPGLLFRDKSRNDPGAIPAQSGSVLGSGSGDGSVLGVGAASGHEVKEKMIQKKQTQKRLWTILAKTWQEAKGSAGAVCPYPRGGFQTNFEALAEAHDQEVVIDAFRLWALDVGEPDRIPFPIEDFMKEAQQYMLKARPPQARPEDPEAAKKREEQARRQSEFETKAGGLLDGMTPRPDEGPQVTDLSQLD